MAILTVRLIIVLENTAGGSRRSTRAQRQGMEEKEFRQPRVRELNLLQSHKGVKEFAKVVWLCRLPCGTPPAYRPIS